MRLKRVIFIIILLIFIIGICVIVKIINDNSKEKASNIESQSTTNETSTVTDTSSLVVGLNKPDETLIRKSINKVEVDYDNIKEIGDNYFIQSTNDVYFNLNSYVGKTIKIEGLIYYYKVGENDYCCAVIRNTPGCCGSDGLAGIDIRLEKDYLDAGTWVEVVGVIEKDIINNSDIPTINVVSIKPKEKGNSFVVN